MSQHTLPRAPKRVLSQDSCPSEGGPGRLRYHTRVVTVHCVVTPLSDTDTRGRKFKPEPGHWVSSAGFSGEGGSWLRLSHTLFASELPLTTIALYQLTSWRDDEVVASFRP